MLILPGLSTLLVGISAATTWAAPSSSALGEDDESASLSHPGTRGSHIIASDDVQDHNRTGHWGVSVPAQLVNLRLRNRARRWKGLSSRELSCSPETTTVCSGGNGTGLGCSGCSTCCPAAEGGFQCCQQGFRCVVSATGAGTCGPDDGTGAGVPNGAVFETITVTTTITSLKASRTIVAISTVFETLTFIDPAKQTQTDAITVTSPRNPAFKRADGLDAPATTMSQAVSASVLKNISPITTSSEILAELLKRQAIEPTGVLTTTVTVATTTTVFVSELTTTITNTIFVTTTVAPRAVTTVFTTTTIFVPPTAGTTVTETRTPTTFLSPNPPSSTVSSVSQSGSSGASSTTSASGSSSSALMPTSSTPTSLPSSSSTTLILPTTSSSPSASSTVSTSSSFSSTTTPSATTSATIETMISSTTSLAAPTTTSTTAPPPPLPAATNNPSLTPEQIAGVVVGIFIFLLLLVGLAFLLRHLVRRRRSALAAARQQITPPHSTPGGGAGGAGGGDTTSVSASGLTGENEVRIVIRPAPKKRRAAGLWPMPPGHRGQTYSFFVEETTTTGESTPNNRGDGGDPATWSIASERGSPRGGTQSGTGTQSGSERGRGSGLVSVGWGNAAAGNLAPPPSAAWRGGRGQGQGGAGPSGSGSGGYPQGSLGIGKAF